MKSAPTPEDQLLTPGLVVDSCFEIISRLGSGGMSTVYKARHLQMDRYMALKVLHRNLALDNASRQRFQREGLAVSLLDHPNIIKIFRVGTVSEQPYIAMEFLEGTSLSALLQQQTRLPKEQALPVFIAILEALAHAHQKGIIHRDLKPSNVMLLDTERTVKLMDFGIAKILPESGKELEKLTKTGAVLGTAAYMSPEQCRGKKLDARADLYSAGCLMYEVLDGKPPYAGDTPMATMSAHLHNQPRKSSYLSDALGAVVLSCLEKDVLKRPQSALQLRDALTDPPAFLKSRNLPRGAPGISKRVAVLAFLLAGIALGYFGSSFWLHPNQNEQTRQTGVPLAASDYALKTASLNREISRVTRDNVELCEKLKALAILYSRAKDHEKSLATRLRELRIREKYQNQEPYQLSRSLADVGMDYEALRKDSQAKPLLLRAKQIKDKLGGKESSDETAILEHLGNIENREKNYAAAEDYYKRCIKIQSRCFGSQSTETRSSKFKLASFFSDRQRYSEEEPLLRQCLSGYEEMSGPSRDDSLLAAVLGEIACVCIRGHRQEEGNQFLTKSLQTYQKALGPVSAEAAHVIDHAAVANFFAGSISEAETLSRRSLDMKNKMYGPNSEGTVFNLHLLANIYRKQGDLPKAESFYKQALSLSERALKAGNKSKVDYMDEPAYCLNDYADLLTSTGRAAEAKALREKARALN